MSDEVCPLFLPPDQIEILDEIMEDENWLDKEEIEGLLHREYDSRLQRILDMFLAMISTGMSYSDMQEYRRSQHLKKEGDYYYVSKRRKKTDKISDGPIKAHFFF